MPSPVATPRGEPAPRRRNAKGLPPRSCRGAPMVVRPARRLVKCCSLRRLAARSERSRCMLKVLRDNVKYLSWILWVIIALFVLFIFADFGAGLGGNNRDTMTWAAKVGSATVSRIEYQHAFQTLDNQYRRQLGEQYSTEIAKQLRLPLRALDKGSPTRSCCARRNASACG